MVHIGLPEAQALMIARHNLNKVRSRCGCPKTMSGSLSIRIPAPLQQANELQKEKHAPCQPCTLRGRSPSQDLYQRFDQVAQWGWEQWHFLGRVWQPGGLGERCGSRGAVQPWSRQARGTQGPAPRLTGSLRTQVLSAKWGCTVDPGAQRPTCAALVADRLGPAAELLLELLAGNHAAL